MTGAEFLALSPHLVLAFGSVAVMLAIGFWRHHLLAAVMTANILVAAMLCLLLSAWVCPVGVTPLMVMDRYGLFFVGLIVLAGLALVSFSFPYLEHRPGNREEFYVLLLLALLGACVLVTSRHFGAFLLGLEILGVSLYGLVAFPRTRSSALEAAVKYLILAGVSDAFLLFGMALIYAELGSMEFSAIGSAAALGCGTVSVVGTALLLVGIGFKLSVVPFHMWTPDVYEGAPAPVTALIATVSKAAVFALLLRYFAGVGVSSYGPLATVFVAIALASMVVGNVLALTQRNVKRILAYSSIAHLGYVLVAFVAGGELAHTAGCFYITAYVVTMLGAFGVVTLVSPRDRDADRIEDYTGLAWTNPWLAGVFTAMLLSLAGIPLTAGFIAKFFAVAAGIGAMLWALVVTLIVTSVFGLYYYLRIVVALYRQPEGIDATGMAYPVGPLASGVALAVLCFLLVWLGVSPSQLIRLIQAAGIPLL